MAEMSAKLGSDGDSNVHGSSRTYNAGDLCPEETPGIPIPHNTTAKQQQSEIFQRFAGLGIGIATLLTENVLSHPFIVFRWQCQVNRQAHRYHLQPFSVVQAFVNLQRHQGFSTMWKGLGSAFMVQGIGLGSEAVISEVTPLVREITMHSTVRQLLGHLSLKAISAAVTMPFLSASVVEMVQSDIASERPGVFDCLKEGFKRLFGWGVPQTTHLLPMYRLLLPTVFYSLLKYILTSVIQYILLQVMHRYKQTLISRCQQDGVNPAPKSIMDAYFPELLSKFGARLITDIALYPCETILLRMHLQGTRTIIDNTDNGYGVIPVSTQYPGAWECYVAIVTEEGRSGLYKGIGALLLQYTLHVIVLKMIQVIYTSLANDFSIGLQEDNVD